MKVGCGVSDSYRKGDISSQADFCKKRGSREIIFERGKSMNESRKQITKKVGSKIRARIVIAVIALFLIIPQIAVSGPLKDNSIASEWHNGMIYIVEQEVRSDNPEAGNRTSLSRMLFSDEKSIYDIIKKIFQSKDKMYSKT